MDIHIGKERRKRVSTVAMADYEDAVESMIGWCTGCRAFTRECTEPDAEGYDCPSCLEHDVVGAENALVMGLLSFEEDV